MTTDTLTFTISSDTFTLACSVFGLLTIAWAIFDRRRIIARNRLWDLCFSIENQVYKLATVYIDVTLTEYASLSVIKPDCRQAVIRVSGARPDSNGIVLGYTLTDERGNTLEFKPDDPRIDTATLSVGYSGFTLTLSMQDLKPFIPRKT